MTSAVEVFAHRGWSGRHPESTRAAYAAAVELARTTGRPLRLEGDVQLSADGQPVVVHDATLERTGGRPDAVAALTVAELKRTDVGSWRTADPTPAERELLTLAEWLELVAEARADGVDVGVAVEAKHPDPQGRDVVGPALEALAVHGWTDADPPARLISFDPDAVARAGALAPELPRSLLVAGDLGPWADGSLPEGVDTVGVHHRLAARHPAWVEALLARGHALHLWTVDDPAEMAGWVRRGATGITTDHPDRALAVLDDGR
ncbi:glycerophosphodiester phosphodiesterase [Desertihabitans aurantiacus]|uniref:glycerophosphodiester phosphodiesterase n=1 Tax=Desertihabitans aurantiacus TaxID=2282477 RepID=UPI001300B0C9|nr:glycerophosphodiester phosphodiesterase family protein [Desertihabitans aurantiacus]